MQLFLCILPDFAHQHLLYFHTMIIKMNMWGCRVAIMDAICVSAPLVSSLRGEDSLRYRPCASHDARARIVVNMILCLVHVPRA